ncbi:Ku protein [Geobacter sp. SVR]|uniref:non-homologous end joining protein Ku n=1 Tax=Geobacter sp. SVR TaxID=2495594 RepID=UPI00143EFAF2|nr:Ku protein [Geobacter sp. SVR]BCS53561.1 non-homologous end joining protein Ku [Geobacter sp. SVR]GCF84242.1 non-homologous end joining protein Ku [Geobacter sp. SVR]
MKAMWSGSISFGLVNIPVKLFSGSESNKLDLDMLRKNDLCAIKYLRVCKDDNKEVPYGEIVKGYEYTDGEYVVLTDQDFESAQAEKSHLIEILNFIDENEIDSRYFEKPYYLEPDKSGSKAYVLLREALKRSGKVGLANYVLRNRGNIGIVKPFDKILVLNAIRYQEEVRSFEELKVPGTEKISDQEIDLALKLIDQLSVAFDPSRYRDTYTDALKHLIEEKTRGIAVQPAAPKPQPAKVVDIMALLKQSLKEHRKAA